MNLYNERFFQAPYNMPTYAQGIGLTFTSDRNPTSRAKDMSNQVIPGISHSLARVTRGMHDQYTPMDEEFFFRKGGLAEQVLGRAQFEGRVHYPYMGKESILHKEGARLVLTGNNFYYPEASFFRKVHMETLEESFFGHMSDLMSRYLDEMTPGLGPRQRDSELSKLFVKAYMGRPGLLEFLGKYLRTRTDEVVQVIQGQLRPPPVPPAAPGGPPAAPGGPPGGPNGGRGGGFPPGLPPRGPPRVPPRGPPRVPPRGPPGGGGFDYSNSSNQSSRGSSRVSNREQIRQSRMDHFGTHPYTSGQVGRSQIKTKKQAALAAVNRRISLMNAIKLQVALGDRIAPDLIMDTVVNLERGQAIPAIVQQTIQTMNPSQQTATQSLVESFRSRSNTAGSEDSLGSDVINWAAYNDDDDNPIVDDSRHTIGSHRSTSHVSSVRDPESNQHSLAASPAFRPSPYNAMELGMTLHDQWTSPRPTVTSLPRLEMVNEIRQSTGLDPPGENSTSEEIPVEGGGGGADVSDQFEGRDIQNPNNDVDEEGPISLNEQAMQRIEQTADVLVATRGSPRTEAVRVLEDILGQVIQRKGERENEGRESQMLEQEEKRMKALMGEEKKEREKARAEATEWRRKNTEKYNKRLEEASKIYEERGKKMEAKRIQDEEEEAILDRELARLNRIRVAEFQKKRAERQKEVAANITRVHSEVENILAAGQKPQELTQDGLEVMDQIEKGISSLKEKNSAFGSTIKALMNEVEVLEEGPSEFGVVPGYLSPAERVVFPHIADLTTVQDMFQDLDYVRPYLDSFNDEEREEISNSGFFYYCLLQQIDSGNYDPNAPVYQTVRYMLATENAKVIPNENVIEMLNNPVFQRFLQKIGNNFTNEMLAKERGIFSVTAHLYLENANQTYFGLTPTTIKKIREVSRSIAAEKKKLTLSSSSPDTPLAPTKLFTESESPNNHPMNTNSLHQQQTQEQTIQDKKQRATEAVKGLKTKKKPSPVASRTRLQMSKRKK